uniref:Amyloid beta like protein 1 n=1 Tax=Loxodonta africana TaxID=9785 RepID=G3UJ10_LOXAF
QAPGSAQVAGLCGRPTLHRDLRTGRWEPDPQRSRRCLRDPQRVLEYCRQMYPELQIVRVEQATQAIPMERWCGGARGGRCAQPHHQVVPFRCLRESLAGGGKPRKESPYLNSHPPAEVSKGEARSTPWLPPPWREDGLRGLGVVTLLGETVGEELFGCNGRDGSGFGEKVLSVILGKLEGWCSRLPRLARTDPIQNYIAHDARQRLLVNGVHDGLQCTLQADSLIPGLTVTPTPRPTDGVDVYFGMPGEISEHEGFLRAKMDLEERRMRQINEVMREWAMADNQSKNLPKADRQALNEHFQSILQTLEEQVSSERQRLVETHTARVIALINDQRRAALEGFLAALQGDPPQAERVLVALRRYLRAEQKEQRHTLRHYQHVAAVDPEKAQQMRFQVQTHLQVIEERMNQSLGLLDQNPHLAQELRPQIQELLRSEHLGPSELEAPIPGSSSEDKDGPQPPDSKDADTSMALPKGSTEQDAASPVREKISPLEQSEQKVNVSVPRGFPFHSSEIQRDELAPAGTGVSREAVSGLLIMAAGGGSLVVLSMLLLRRKKPYGAISHGVVEVDPMLTLEEQQLRELQHHGYENPTYRFLEERP